MAAAAASFLFSPVPDRSSVRRILVPRPSYRGCSSSSKKTGLYCQKYSNLNWNATGKVLCNQVKSEDVVNDEACELVNGVDLIIGEGQDSIHAYLFKAVKNNNGTGVLLLSDVFGFEDSSTRDFAYRVACSGYNVLAPDLFRGNPWKTSEPVSDLERWLAKQSPERVADDIKTSVNWLADGFMEAGMPKKLGIIGFSYGGGLLMETLAGDGRQNFGSGVCFYGTGMDASLAEDIKVPVLFISGDNDPLCSVGELREIEKSMGCSRVMIYRGRGHGFAHRPESMEEDEQAEDAFAVMRSWLHDGLVVSQDYAR